MGDVTLSLVSLNVKRLRSYVHAERKNYEMMSRLMNYDWFRKYRRQLRAWRVRAAAWRARQGPRPLKGPPVYPDEGVEEVELQVDKYMLTLFPEYTR